MKYLDLLKRGRPCPFDNPKPRDIVAENGSAYITYSLASYHRDQMLVVPKRHITRLEELSQQELMDCEALQKSGLAMLRKLGHGGVSFVLREGETTGKTIPHLHYNLIPDTRMGDMDAKGEEKRDIMTEEEIAATVARLREAYATLHES
jgi:diadenosine tetraphosphate (Ap4A) HIT family hydrolase